MQPASLGQAIWPYIATYGTPLLAYLVLRALTVHLVLYFMMRRAPGPAEVEEPVTEERGAEALSKGDLHFFELSSAKGIVLDNSFQDRLERALETGRRTWGLFWKSLLLFAVTFTICLGTAAEETQLDIVDAVFLALPCLLAVLALIVLIATVSKHYRSTGRVPLLLSISGVLPLVVLAYGVGEALALPVYLYLLPPVCSALMVGWGYATIRRAARADGNLKLLILRVFGSDRNTPFVFGPLMRSWQFLGVFFTIVDPSYIRYQFSLSSGENRRKLLRFFVLFGLLIAALSWGQYFLFQILPSINPALVAWQDLSPGLQRELLGMVAWLILIPLAVFPVLATVRSRFIQNPSELNCRIDNARRQNGGWSGIFKGFPMYCYDNVWKKAVDALLQVSDVVLMDLRGFSPARLGCEYEVGVLINRHAIQRIVFLVDQETKESVYQLICRRWSHLSPMSPNRSLESPTIKVYVPGDEEARDIPRILALLVAAVERDGESASSIVSFEGAPRRSNGRPRTRSKTGWRRLAGSIAEALDMASATPKYSRIVIVLLLVTVLGMFYLRLQPVVRSFKTYSNPQAVTLPDPDVQDDVQDAAGQPAPVYLKAKADAEVSEWAGFQDGKSYSNPIVMRIDFTGGVASEAHRYGQVKVTSAIGDTGDRLEILKIGSDHDAQTDFILIDRSAKDFFTEEPEHPQDGFRLEIAFFKPEKELAQVRSLAGTLTLQTIDPARTFRMENVGARLSGPGVVQLKHPKLDAIGEASLLIRESDPETVQLVIKGKRLQDIDARIVDAHGNLLPSGGTGTLTVGEEVTQEFGFSIKDKSLTNARLDIIFGYTSIEAPFNVENIVIQK